MQRNYTFFEFFDTLVYITIEPITLVPILRGTMDGCLRVGGTRHSPCTCYEPCQVLRTLPGPTNPESGRIWQDLATDRLWRRS